MKSFKKLEGAYQQLTWMQQAIRAGKQVLPDAVNYTMDLLNEFMVDNERTKNKSFNIWDWTVIDSLRPVMEGVFHDKLEEYAVATNAHMLVADKDSYDESKTDNGEGLDGFRKEFRRPINKYGKFIDGRFPNWLAVIPQKTDHIKYKVSLQDLDEYIKKCNAWMKLNGYTGKYRKTIVYKVTDGAYYNAEYLRTFLVATNEELYIKDKMEKYGDDKRACYWSDTRQAIIMHLLVDDDKFIDEAKELGLLILER